MMPVFRAACRVPVLRAVCAAIGTVLIAAALPPAAVQADPYDAGGSRLSYRTVRDVANRFTIDVPVNWKTTLSRGDPALSAIAPAAEGDLPASLFVIVRDMPFPISAETCIYDAQWVMRHAIPKYASLRTGPDHIGALPAWSHAYIWMAKTGQERRSIQTCVTLGRRAILAISTTANRPERLRDDMPALDHALRTLRPVAMPSGPDPAHAGHNMSRGVVRRGSM